MSILENVVPHRSSVLPNAPPSNPVECPFVPLWTTNKEAAMIGNSS